MATDPKPHGRSAGLIPLALACLLAACTGDRTLAGGGGIETTDGQIAAVDGNAATARVRLVPESWNPMIGEAFPDSLTAATDASGRYAFRNLRPGRYNLEAYAAGDGARLFAAGVEARAGGSTLPKAALSRPGRLRLRWEGSHHGWLFMRGTTLVRRILPAEIEAAVIEIDSLPAGTLPPMRWSQSKSDTAGRAITDSLRILPDAVTEHAVFAAWKHSGTWSADTRAAGVSGDVTDFPALVRLAAPHFDFSQAAVDGADLRFSSPAGAELPHQVERWDAAAGRAEIWVRLPLVKGADSAAAFRMHWGNPVAGAHSSGSAVFDSAAGFAAVWHLAEAANTAEGGYRDASPNALHGTASALAESPDGGGAIAGGLKLDGSKRVMVPDGKALNIADRISVAAWFKADMWQGGNRRMVQKGIGMTQYALAGYGADSVEWRLVLNGAQYSLRAPAPPLGEWHHIHGTYDGKRSILYLDGVAAVAGDFSGPIGLASDSLAIGFAPSGPDTQHFLGVLDEITVSPTPRSADWVRLAYLNQKPGSVLLRLEIGR